MFLKAYIKKFPKHKPAIDRNMELLQRKGYVGIFAAKLIPMIRTLISIPAGVMRMNLVKYSISSTMGIFLWNFVFVGAGYLLGDAVFGYLGVAV